MSVSLGTYLPVEVEPSDIYYITCRFGPPEAISPDETVCKIIPMDVFNKILELRRQGKLEEAHKLKVNNTRVLRDDIITLNLKSPLTIHNREFELVARIRKGDVHEPVFVEV